MLQAVATMRKWSISCCWIKSSWQGISSTATTRCTWHAARQWKYLARSIINNKWHIAFKHNINNLQFQVIQFYLFITKWIKINAKSVESFSKRRQCLSNLLVFLKLIILEKITIEEEINGTGIGWRFSNEQYLVVYHWKFKLNTQTVFVVTCHFKLFIIC